MLHLIIITQKIIVCCSKYFLYHYKNKQYLLWHQTY